MSGISVYPNPPTDYLTAVRDGLVPGKSLDAIICRNPAVGAAFEDLWGEGGIMVQPTGAESYELVSDDVNDTAAGTGMRTVLVQTRGSTGLTEFQTVTMNGTTAVALTGTHTYPAGLFGGAADQTATGKNIGTIRLQVAAGGNVRNVMLPGVGRSHDTHYKVASNQSAIILTTHIFPPKSANGVFMNEFRSPDADSCWQSGSVLGYFENAIDIDFQSRPPLPSGYELRLQAESTTGGSQDVSLLFELLLTDIS